VATIHTLLPEDRPGHHGEFLVGQTLSKFSDPRLELWFDVNYIPGVTDIDLILCDSQVGLYVVEIKSMRIDAIQKFTNTEFVLIKDQSKQHPIIQVRIGQSKLRDFLKRIPKFQNKRNMLFVQTTVLWSEITRKEWKQRFSEPEMSFVQESMIFKDDLTSYNMLISALQRIWERPLLGITTPGNARGAHGDMMEFRRVLAPQSNVIEISASMATELSRPVSQSKRTAEKYTPPGTYKASLQGPPGTGKTTILREIGLMYASAGAAVLHVCFNKVLAAEQKREYQLLKKNSDDYGFIDVFDVWELYKELGFSGGIAKESEVVENVRVYLESEEGKHRVKYDLILVDESQDLRQNFFEVLEKIARPSASWIIAYGKGQETNNFELDASHPSPWLSKFLAEAEANNLKRSFRNSTRAFLIAQSFWEKFPSLTDAKEWIKKRYTQQLSDENQFELDLALPQAKNDFRIETLPAGPARKSAIKTLILVAIEDARKANRGEDLLVGVIKPSSNKPESTEFIASSSYELVKEVLLEISDELKIVLHDLVPNENRREITKIGAIRLVTLQGIRGLSASHVLLFDLDQLEYWTKSQGNSIKPPMNNLGYIALSRSRASTIVALGSNQGSDVETFLFGILAFATQESLRLADK
jgi:hypothetical protein